MRSGVTTSRTLVVSCGDALAQAAELAVEQLLRVAEHAAAGQRHRDEVPRERRRHPGDAAEEREQHAQRAVRDVRERDQPQRGVGGRAVDHDQVVAPGLGELLDGEQRGHLFGARQQRQLLGDDGVEALVREQLDQEVPDLAPVALRLDAGVDLDRVETRRELARVGARGAARSTSPRLWAASAEATSVRRPRCAAIAAVAAAVVVFPTPPLPV